MQIKKTDNDNRKFPKKSTLFLRYLYSYVLVLFLPILIIGMLFFSYFFSIFEDEVIKNHNNELFNIQSSIDTSINELSSLAFQISSNPRLTSYRMLNNPLDTKDGINDLKNYIIANNFIDDVYLYIPGNDMIYSSTRTYSMKQFFENQFIYKSWSIQNFKDFFEANKGSKLEYSIRPSEPVYCKGEFGEYVTILFPFVDKMVYFVINEKQIFDSVYDNTSIILTNRDNKVIASSINGIFTQESSLKAVLTQKIMSGDSPTIEIEGSRYFISKSKSSVTGWICYSLLPFEHAMKKVIQAKAFFIYGLLLVLILGIFIISFVMRLNYNPIKNLKKFAEKNYGNSSGTKNELEAVKNAISGFVETSKALKERVEKSHNAVREYLLLNLLKGSYANVEKFNEVAKEEKLLFTHNFYTTAILKWKKEKLSKKLNRSQITSFIEENLPEDIEGYGKDALEENKLVFIFSHSGENFSKLKTCLVDIQNILYENFKIHLSIGIGNSYDSISQIGKSYIEASTALDYRLVKGIDSVIHFEESIPDNDFIVSYPIQDLKTLEMAILNSDTSGIPKIISGLIDIMLEKNLSLFNARCLSFDIISTVIKTLSAISKEFLYSEYEFPDVLSLNEFETITELGNVIEKFSLDICEYIAKNKKLNQQNFISQLISYIDGNYTDYNFSIQSMSYYFGMSPSNLGHYFKGQTGKSIMQYVNVIRIKKAKELLLGTDYTVNEIITKLGYCDTSSFIRKFKKDVGTTPGNYRKSISGKAKFTPS